MPDSVSANTAEINKLFPCVTSLAVLSVTSVGAVESIKKFVALVAVPPFTVTVIGPEVAPTGTEVVIEVEVDELTIAVTPLNFTVLFAGVLLKFAPVIVTIVPMLPSGGSKLVIIGDGNTVKFVGLIKMIPLTIIKIGPSVAPAGTNTVNVVDVAAVTVAEVPLNVTRLLAGVVLKFVPVIITVAPTAPLEGSKLEKVGVGNTLKPEALVTVTPLTVT